MSAAENTLQWRASLRDVPMVPQSSVMSLHRASTTSSTIEKSLQEYRAILQKLFPNVHPEQLAGMSREKLIDLISKTGPFQAPSPVTPGQEEKQLGSHADAGTLEQLQPLPEEPEDTFQPLDRARTFSSVSEEVNILSLTGKESSSYLGISSVMAVLRVILWLDPECQTFVTPDQNTAVNLAREWSRTPSILELGSSTTPVDEPKPSTWSEPAIIDAYFQYAHPATPIVDEQTFRDTYLAANRTDSRWLLLVNSVLTIGSIAASTSAASTTHEYYFILAREHLTVDTLGTAHIETVQALALLSGYYLHYVQEAGLANAIMGATLRMSTMLGLHRDFSEGLGPSREASNLSKASFSIEMRRRIWWSLFMLDTWAGSTLGRPSMGRMSPAVTSKVPREPIGGSETCLQLMHDSIRFCQISTRLEDSLAVSPNMDDLERQSLDTSLSEWYQQSSVVSDQTSISNASQYHSPHSTLSSAHDQSDPPGILLTKNLMRWRYHLSRVILHRPALLWWAMRSHRQTTSTKTSKPAVLDASRRAAIETCRTVTSELITDICANWTTSSLPPSTMSAWHATSLLYQAVMVPLLSLFSEAHDQAVTNQSRQLIDVSIDAFEEMQRWCKGAKRSLEVVTQIMLQMPTDEMLLGDHTDGMNDPMGMNAFGGSSASASISGGIDSGGLGTPATLPPASQITHTIVCSNKYTRTTNHHLPSHNQPTPNDLPLSIFRRSLWSPPSHNPTPSNNPFIHPGAGTTPSASSTSAHSNSAYLESSTNNLLDSLTWSQGWTDTNYPFETPRLGWDPMAMHGWVGGIDPAVNGGGSNGYEYFAAAGGGQHQGEAGGQR
ncbi:Regulatory protein GAL4 [Cyphellophora attinorum]|uniref:Regulatory protein GAL4 n=1 Tax=Cyphellophora attinorum TaxID=1664694 RepID=A0A0N1P2V9_9EURO|nr:Regulatory protein GAL4 [Phialophora attinorum]KPI43036.1 Regulatory protein GAL4 [Phialophora attinorum]